MGYAVTHATKSSENDARALYAYGTDPARLDGQFSVDKATGKVTSEVMCADDRPFASRTHPPYLRRILGKGAEDFEAGRYPDTLTVY